MNTTSNWPLFSTSASIDNRINSNGQQNSFDKMITQKISSNETILKSDDTDINSHPKQMTTNFNHISKSNNNSDNYMVNNNTSNGQNQSLRVIEEDDDFDEEDESLIDSIADDDSLPSPDAMYATSYLSNDSNDRNGTHKDHIKQEMGSEGKSIGEESPIGPLAQLQNALERHSGMLGMNLTDFSVSNGNTPSLFSFGTESVGPMGTAFNVDNDITGELYRCHLCSYSGTSKCQFNAHMNTHFDHKCAFCDYTSRTEGRLKRHIRDFHSEIPPDSWAGNRVLKESSELDGDDSIDGTDASVNGSGGNSKSRKYKCKQCEFVATCKQEFWGHSKAHIKSEKLLSCTKCSFVTEYKHHLEYHLRNHFGSKPFKCAKCNYSCVNKSMLNSHMKSHSNIYQYRCADCSYATKYCHSLKLHLRKYQHKPATVLNLDGTPNPYPVIDVYGTRRGPRPKKSKPNKNSQNQQKSQHLDSSLSTPMISSSLSPNLLNITPVPPLIPASMPMTLPFIYPPNSSLLHSGLLGQQSMSQIHRLNSLPQSLYESVGAQNRSNSPNSSSRSQTQSPSHMNNKLKCNFCEFCTETREVFGKHLLAHVAAENQDVCRIYGMTPSAEMVQQNAIISELAARQSPDSRCLLEQIAVNPSLINTLLAMHSQPKAHHLTLDWHSAQDSPSVDISPQSISTNTESRYLARPESVPIGANIKGILSPVIPRSKSSPTNSHESVEKHNNQTNTMSRQLPSDTTPLDLSSNKSTSPLIQAMDSKNTGFAEQLLQSSLVSYPRNEDKQTDEHNMSICVPSSGAPPQPPPPPPSESQSERQQSRAQRRKGRASKLNVNRCTKIISQSLKNDELSEDLCEETGDSVVEDMEPDVDHIISKINNATSLLQEILIDMYSLKNDAYH